MPADAAKAAVLLFFVVVVQLSIMAQVTILGGHPNLLLVTLVCVALLRGAVFAAIAGFAAGLLVDSGVFATLGFTALLLTLAGYWTGRYGETTGRDRAHAPILSIAVITILYQVAALVLRFMLGQNAPAGAIFAGLVPTVFLNLILIVPVYAFTRRLLRPREWAPRFLRLWSLQILNGEQLLRASQNNQRREVRVSAPRGSIVDRRGLPLVTNVPSTVVQIDQSSLPKRKNLRLRELRKLSRILHVPLREIGVTLRRHRYDLLTPVTIKSDVSEAQAGYLDERSDDFPGVRVRDVALRYYPHRELAAHVLGYVGDISQDQLDALAKQGYRPGDTIGQSGIESEYDKFLRGTPGLEILRVNSLGRKQGATTPLVPAHPGNTVRLTLDLKLQIAAEEALRYGIERARNSGCQGCWYANGGAIVALDPRDGSIRAMASNPTYRPSLYVGRVRQRALDAAGLTSRSAESMNYPALDRAINAAYPPGSTFKPVTAIAAMQEHILQPFEPLACTGQYEKNGQVFKNWDPFVNESMTLTTALARSCDTYFYQVGYRFYGMPARLGPRLQAWASRFGFGQKTGIDLGSERSGLLPTPAWRKETYTKKTDPGHWQIDRLWKPGDSIQLAIGQKDLLVTPLHRATATCTTSTSRGGAATVRPTRLILSSAC